MTWNKRAFPAVALALLLASPATAQVTGQPYEFSAHVGALVFDSRAYARNGPAAAATLGWRAASWITLEGQGLAGMWGGETARPKQKGEIPPLLRSLGWNLGAAGQPTPPHLLTRGAHPSSKT